MQSPLESKSILRTNQGRQDRPTPQQIRLFKLVRFYWDRFLIRRQLIADRNDFEKSHDDIKIEILKFQQVHKYYYDMWHILRFPMNSFDGNTNNQFAKVAANTHLRTLLIEKLKHTTFYKENKNHLTFEDLYRHFMDRLSDQLNWLMDHEELLGNLVKSSKKRLAEFDFSRPVQCEFEKMGLSLEWLSLDSDSESESESESDDDLDGGRIVLYKRQRTRY